MVKNRGLACGGNLLRCGRAFYPGRNERPCDRQDNRAKKPSADARRYRASAMVHSLMAAGATFAMKADVVPVGCPSRRLHVPSVRQKYHLPPSAQFQKQFQPNLAKQEMPGLIEINTFRGRRKCKA
jgi:hypothetical protein